MTSIDELADVIRGRYPAAAVSLHRFASGCVSLDVVSDGRLFVMDYRPGEGYGLSTGVRDDEGFLGHTNVYIDLSSAAPRLLDSLDTLSRHDESTPSGTALDAASARRRVS